MIISMIRQALVGMLIAGGVSSLALAADADEAEKITQIETSVSQTLEPLFTGVNEQKRPSKAELAAWQKLINDSRRYFQKMKPQQQSQFLLLDAWVCYFGGNLEQAHKNAVFAYGKDLTSGDALATQIAMALAANKRPMPPKPPKKQKVKTGSEQGNMPGGMPGMPGMPDMTAADTSGGLQPGRLVFDYKTLLFQAIGKQLKEPQSLVSLNKTTLTYQPGQDALCILAWRKYDPNAADETEAGQDEASTDEGMGAMPGMPGMPGMDFSGGYGTDGANNPIAAFAKLFERGLAAGGIQFLALNFDAKDRKPDILKDWLKTPTAWAQVMAAEQKKDFSIDPKVDKLPANQPILVMVDKLGTVRYAGSPVGFIAPMLLGELTSDKLKPAPAAETAPLPEDSNSQSAVETDPQPAIAAQPAPEPTQQFRELSEEESIRAEQLLAPTRDLFMKTGQRGFTTYKNGVEMCRKVMRDFPGTKYAYEAQMLLRKVPENKRGQYGITDQELGL